MLYRVEATATACVWRTFDVEAENVDEAERKAQEIAAADRGHADPGYTDSGTDWELHGLMSRVAVTVSDRE